MENFQRTEDELKKLHNEAICSILNGRCANYAFDQWSMDSLVDDAIDGANSLLQKLKERDKELPQKTNNN